MPVVLLRTGKRGDTKVKEEGGPLQFLHKLGNLGQGGKERRSQEEELEKQAGQSATKYR